jgi:hypothetical protein
MLSHPLLEVQAMGNEIKQVSQNNVPTLVKYAYEVPYWIKVANSFASKTEQGQFNSDQSNWCRLEHADHDAEKLVLASLLVRFSQLSYEQALKYIQQMDGIQLETLVKEVTENIDRFDIPVRELEYATFIFDLIMDQGAYFEIKRHRMMTQTVQRLSTLLGYAVPKSFVDAGFENEYHDAMQLVHQTYLEIADWSPEVASYIVPNGYNRRLLLRANLRSLDHLLNLRSAPNAHFSVRRIAQRMTEEIIDINPLLGYWIRRDNSETWQSIENGFFSEIAHQI